MASRKKNLLTIQIGEWLSKCVESFLRPNGTMRWTEALEAAELEFGEENVTLGRLRHVYQSVVQGNSWYKGKATIEDKTTPGEIHFKRDGDNGSGTIVIPSQVNPMDLKLDDIVKIFKLDVTIWECTGFGVKAWQTAMKTKSPGKDFVQPTNWSIAAKFKRRLKLFITKELFKDVFEQAKTERILERVPIKRRKGFAKNSNNVFVPAMYDVHLGKLSWNGETGENYDIKIAEARYKKIFVDLLDRAILEGFDKTIFICGQDFFHVDNDKNQTNAGTVLDADVRYQKLLRKGIDLQRWAIMKAAEYAFVDVIYVPGNHDKTMSFASFEALRGYFHYDNNVVIDEDVKTRTYREEGKNLLAFAHGDEEGKRLFTLMQHEARQAWGRTKYAEWILGHLHREIVKEDQGVTTRTMNSLTGTDAWHYKKGFTGSRIAAQGLIYNRNHIGPRTIFYSAIDLEEEELQK